MDTHSSLQDARDLVCANNLHRLIEHRTCVQANDSVAKIYDDFKTHGHEYAAVLEGEKWIGMVSRSHLGFLLGGRYGFAVFGRQPVSSQLLPNAICATGETPVLEVLDQTMAREGESFYDDIALVDDQRRVLGIIPMHSLIQIQTHLILEKSAQAEQQQNELAAKNEELLLSLNQLRQSQGRYGILFENSALGVALLNTEGQVETWNRQFEKLLGGFSPTSSPLTRNLLNMIAPKERERFIQLLAESATTPERKTQKCEFLVQLPESGPRHFKFFTNWIPETGQICLLLDDISEQKAMEQHLAQKEKSTMLETLVGGIAHEINNKLAPVLMLSDLVIQQTERLKDAEELRGFCALIRTSAEESAKIIRQLLNLSRPPALEVRREDLHQIVEEAMAILKYRIRESKCTVELIKPARPVYLEIDAPQIKQVVFNLVYNALDAMAMSEQRRLRLAVSVEDQQAVLEVEDTGCGISNANIERIFDPFFTTKRTDKGTGLGLSVCLSIIKQHDGEILVHSTPDVGTVFKIILPMKERPHKEVPAQRDFQPSALKPAPLPPAASGSRRVLVVDDEDFIAGMLRTTLELKLGCVVEVAGNGRQAVEKLKNADFDLIVSDIRMPDMNGLDLYDWLKVKRPHLLRRVFFITGDAGSQELEEMVQAFGVAILRKPFLVESLLAECAKHLSGQTPVLPQPQGISRAEAELAVA